MADDRSKVGKADRDRINVEEDYELRNAVQKVGPMAKDVQQYLGR